MVGFVMELDCWVCCVCCVCWLEELVPVPEPVAVVPVLEPVVVPVPEPVVVVVPLDEGAVVFALASSPSIIPPFLVLK
jgi:hypothetical protein